MGGIDKAFLKEKTDAECRQLASHYYTRARKAEKKIEELRETIHDFEQLFGRVHGAAYALIEVMKQQGEQE